MDLSGRLKRVFPSQPPIRPMARSRPTTRSQSVSLISPLVRRLMHLDTLRDEEELAGYKELGEKQAPGMFPQRETKPEKEEF